MTPNPGCAYDAIVGARIISHARRLKTAGFEQAFFVPC